MDFDAIFQDADFESAWESDLNGDGKDEPDEETLNQPTEQYQYVDGVARCKQLAMLLSVYFHAVHGEKSLAIVKPSETDDENNLFPETRLSFYLNAN